MLCLCEWALPNFKRDYKAVWQQSSVLFLFITNVDGTTLSDRRDTCEYPSVWLDTRLWVYLIPDQHLLHYTHYCDVYNSLAHKINSESFKISKWCKFRVESAKRYTKMVHEEFHHSWFMRSSITHGSWGVPSLINHICHKFSNYCLHIQRLALLCNSNSFRWFPHIFNPKWPTTFLNWFLDNTNNKTIVCDTGVFAQLSNHPEWKSGNAKKCVCSSIILPVWSH